MGLPRTSTSVEYRPLPILKNCKMRSRNASMSTLANYKEKASKFQRAINLINVIMIVEAIFLINQGLDLFNFYHLGQLSFWCHYFVWFPTSVCALGVFLFVSAIFSIGVASRPNSNDLCYRILLGIIAVLYCIAFFGAIFMTFCVVKLDGSINESDPKPASVLEHLELYGKDPTVTDDWDFLQQDLRCCGGTFRDVGNGYEIWNRMEHTDNSSYKNWNPYSSKGKNVPDSCCIPNANNAKEPVVEEGCGICAYHDNPAKCKKDENARISRVLDRSRLVNLPETIWINSCVYVLVERIKSKVQPYIWYYALAGTVLALEGIIIVALASAYIAAINRRIRREDGKRKNTNLRTTSSISGSTPSL